MIKRNAVAFGLLLIAAALLSQLGYTIYRDRRFDQERQRQSDAAKDAARLTDGHRAWQVAIKFLDSDFESWLKKKSPAKENAQPPHISLDLVLVKIYEDSAVRWTDDRTVSIIGYISASARDDQHFDWTKWTRRVWRMDDGEWAYPGSPQFEDVSIPPATGDKWPTQTIRAPAPER